MVVVAAMPSASDAITTSATPRVRLRLRRLYRKSLMAGRRAEPADVNVSAARKEAPSAGLSDGVTDTSIDRMPREVLNDLEDNGCDGVLGHGQNRLPP